MYQLGHKLQDYVESEKYLDVYFHHQSSWSTHCEMAVEKATTKFNLLRRTCYFIHDSKQRRALYLILVRSILFFDTI